jgi:hypothetical protein
VLWLSQDSWIRPLGCFNPEDFYVEQGIAATSNNTRQRLGINCALRRDSGADQGIVAITGAKLTHGTLRRFELDVISQGRDTIRAEAACRVRNSIPN